MLALNVSSDVLDGFTQVHDGLKRSNSNVGQRNDAIYAQLEAANELNPGKARVWLDKASDVRRETKALYEHIGCTGTPSTGIPAPGRNMLTVIAVSIFSYTLLSCCIYRVIFSVSSQ